MNKPVKYSPEVRDRAVRMVLEHQDGHGSQWEAIASIGGKNCRRMDPYSTQQGSFEGLAVDWRRPVTGKTGEEGISRETTKRLRHSPSAT